MDPADRFARSMIQRTLMDKGSTATADWLDPARWDALTLVGTGSWARVYRAGGRALKVAHPHPKARAACREELCNYSRVAGTPAEPLAPRLFAARDDGRAHLRTLLRGPSLLEMDPVEVDWTAFAEAHLRVEAFFTLTGVRLDFTPPNLFWSARGFVLCDLGTRYDPSPFANRPPEALADAMAEYLSHTKTRAIEPFLPPPSARFHVEVRAGRVAHRRLLWRNPRVAPGLSDRALLALGNTSTQAPVERRTHVFAATRYQDGPRKKHGRGDGRVLFVGEHAGDEITVKGCGPTPLAWRGTQYHEDGRVSLPRTLWETSVSDELHRLGFVAPRIAAIVDTNTSTVDNTEVEWPAAVAVRLSKTHYRAGHLHRLSRRPPALGDLLTHVAHKLGDDDFDVRKGAHVERFFWRFNDALAHDVGRTEALNIRCFNPTMGNVRLDGHMIDFSTVRFFDHTPTNFVFMNGTRTTREHVATLRRHSLELLRLLRRTGHLSDARGGQIEAQVKRRFERACFAGYLAGVSAFIGLPLAHLVHRRAAQQLVRNLRRLRALRADNTLHFRYWDQTCAAPLFDLEHRAAKWLADFEPTTLRSEHPGALSTFARHCAQQAAQHLRALVDVDNAQPRAWPNIVRPFMELEALAHLCYERSSPAAMNAWCAAMAGHRGAA